MARSSVVVIATITGGVLAGRPPADAVLTPEMFGAKGDGVTNDTQAFQKLSEHLSQRGGGVVALRRTTYLVGEQAKSSNPDWSFTSGNILDCRNLHQPLVIEGNGARLLAASGLRYGTFDRESALPTRRPMPNLKWGEQATPYQCMIAVVNCSNTVTIRNIELDGNIQTMNIGGPWGDSGYQITMVGLFLSGNTGAEAVTSVFTHHHGQDGIQIDGATSKSEWSIFTDVSAEYNGRQGLSVVGGAKYSFRQCKFNHTGRSAISSAPGAGVDLEAEGSKTNRALRFEDCQFADNVGGGLLADSGDTEDVSFLRCVFIAGKSWSAWPRKPRLTFDDCDFVGQIVQCYGDDRPERATQFHSCRFSDDPKRTDTGTLWSSGGANAVADLGAGSKNVLFNKCDFRLTHDLVLPWSIDAIYADCVMLQTSSRRSYPRGTYIGKCSIAGNVDINGSVIRGQLTLNGQIQPRS